VSTHSNEKAYRDGTGANHWVLAALCAASFLAALNFFAFAPFLLPMARDLNTTVPLVGQVATLLGLISAGLGLVVGPWADRQGYRKALVLGTIAIALNLAGTGLAPSYPVLVALSFAAGLGDALVFGVALAAAGTHFTGDARQRAIAWTTGSLGAAPIVGVPILTTIGEFVGWRVALISAGLCATSVAWFIAATLPPDDPRPTSRFRLGELLAAYAPLLRHPPTLRLYSVSLLSAIPWLGLIVYLNRSADETRTAIGYAPRAGVG
jgi:DHA1 family inner membrane transport protein